MAAVATNLEETIAKTINLTLPGVPVQQISTVAAMVGAKAPVGNSPTVAQSGAATSSDTKQTVEFQQSLEALAKEYNEYAEAQKKTFVPPVAHITLEDNAEGIEVHIETTFNETEYHFDSMKFPRDLKNYYEYLNHEIVRAKIADGKTKTYKQTEEIVLRFSEIFKKKPNKPAKPYSCLVVTDAENQEFIGVAFLTEEAPGIVETGRMNREETWSVPPQKAVKAPMAAATATPALTIAAATATAATTAAMDTMAATATTRVSTLPAKVAITKQHKGVGTVETCTLLQLAAHSKSKGYLVQGETLTEVIATARTDNKASWMSIAKAGMELERVGVMEKYGKEPRYFLRKTI